nr:disease resistance protein tao1 [Quercus suber]
MECLENLLLGGTAIKELPSSTIHLKPVTRVSFKGCQLSSSSLTSMPRSDRIDLRDCNLWAIPSGIDRFSRTGFFDLFLRGNDFVPLPESISQFSKLTRLYLDGCKSLRSLSNIPSKVYFICVDNCTSLERLPEPPNDFYWSSSSYNYTVQCFNCFKLAYNIQNFSNMFEGQSSQQFEKCYIIPGREIPKCQRHHRYQQNLEIRVSGCQMRRFSYEPYPSTWLDFKSEYGKVESHHLWLHSMSKEHFRLQKTPGCSIDNKGFHKVELEIETQGLEVEKIGFPVGLKIPIKISEARDEDDGEFFSSLLLPAYQRVRQTSQGFGE